MAANEYQHLTNANRLDRKTGAFIISLVVDNESEVESTVSARCNFAIMHRFAAK